MSAFVLKIIAIISMFIDHLGYAIFNGNSSYLNFIGKLAFPIFAFEISEGYVYTKNLKKYFLRLSLFAIISQISFMVFASIIPDYGFVLNILFTLLLGLTAICVYDKSTNKFFGILLATIIGLVAQFTNCDYGFYGVAIILLFYIFKNNFIKASFAFVLATFIKYVVKTIIYGFQPRFVFLFISACISLIFLALYNGDQGRKSKYLFYIFYPIHFLIIYGIYLIIH